MRFKNRIDAGRRLAERLIDLYGNDNPVILALPRGGVPVAYEVARALQAPLDVLVARKLGAPFQPEFGFGAIAPNARYIDRETVQMLNLSDADIEAVAADELRELERRIALYRNGRPEIDVRGRTVILVDDGLATGVTAQAAIASLKTLHPKRIVFAVPVGAPDSLAKLEKEGVSVEYLLAPEGFRAVGAWYEDFSQTGDTEVTELLLEAAKGDAEVAAEKNALIHYRYVEIDVNGATLAGELHVPAAATTLIVFAHGSGSSRLSRRNRQVADFLQRAGHATLLFDLLSTAEEEVDARIGHLRFDIDLLAQRLAIVTEWVRLQGEFRAFNIGYFGASTGAAAAIAAASMGMGEIKAIVSRGGRPDLAGDALERLQSPILFIVGSRDEAVLHLNERARAKVHAPSELALVEGAGHLFEEAGALEEVARLARDWFTNHLQHDMDEFNQPLEEQPWE